MGSAKLRCGGSNAAYPKVYPLGKAFLPLSQRIPLRISKLRKKSDSETHQFIIHVGFRASTQPTLYLMFNLVELLTIPTDR